MLMLGDNEMKKDYKICYHESATLAISYLDIVQTCGSIDYMTYSKSNLVTRIVICL